MSDYDVVIVGSGPSGIAAATALVQAGITNIMVLEREAELGGRHPGTTGSECLGCCCGTDSPSCGQCADWSRGYRGAVESGRSGTRLGR